jgi:hypothetical protein
MLQLWDVMGDTPTVQQSLALPRGPPRQVYWSPDGALLLGRLRKAVFLWDLKVRFPPSSSCVLMDILPLCLASWPFFRFQVHRQELRDPRHTLDAPREELFDSAGLRNTPYCKYTASRLDL